MTANPTQPVTNELINCLSNTQSKWLLTHSKPVELKFGQILNTTDRPIANVYFPLTGFISMFVEIIDEWPVEMGLIGSEGMLGATLSLGKLNAPMQAVVRGPGKALRIDAKVFCQYLKTNASLQEVIQRYLYVLIKQLSLAGACMYSHDVSQRLARCLLMVADKCHTSQFNLTHKHLAEMVGVRRSAITIAAGGFQRAGLIKYSRGQIEVLSKDGLKHASCQCYIASLHFQKQEFPSQQINKT
ncbi:Crp/Fnr family transcriptional regulator [Alteromonas sp. 1_MG-2023]|uniref:Crp/Fnr family transcriptional regulator n=1 Tax=Alteromonas sp. 1_MG-2023 TaxID=3062669 RepID=UPI0026E41C7E|nr:Crp/Fnr family transcriptional regulator [Alteromonas sp. 1_MG-2023]MDO6477924.1 Crp/Fnr family transcriptional regulator [Alteromonas sp. 1_MG-2023]